MTYILLIVGLCLLLLGADKLVDASVAIAQKAKISNFIIGITIVGMGTSSPELFVSLSSAIAGKGDLALGNVIGSNICNTLLILGTTALVLPFAITKPNLRRDIPFAIFTSVIVMLMCLDRIFPLIDENEIGRLDGIVLLFLFAAYMGYTILASKKAGDADNEEPQQSTFFTGKTLWMLIPSAVLSLVVLLYGGNMFLDSAVQIASEFGLSDKVISLTIVAIGTSLPELITCIIAARKGNPQLALGNVLGSNVFNLLFILGVSALCRPIVLQAISLIDFGVLILGSILTFVFAFTLRKRIIDRAEGALLIAVYLIYMAYLLFA